MNSDPFKAYIRQSEPDKQEKGYAWHTAIGLQAVDGLKTSEYLAQTAIRNIEGEITLDEANALLQAYYNTRGRFSVLTGGLRVRQEYPRQATCTENRPRPLKKQKKRE